MYCKLTNQMMQTRNGFQWEVGKWYRIPDKDRGDSLCSKSWFHCYNHPLLVVLLNPIHADVQNPRLFRVNVKGRKTTDNGLKFGFSMMKLAKEIPLPEISTTQRIAFGILCAKQVYKDKDWNEWADNWLNNKDRNCAAAYAAYAAYAAVDAAVDAAAYAAYAAAYAAYAADAAVDAYAAVAAAAAYAAAYAAYAYAAAAYAADAAVDAYAAAYAVYADAAVDAYAADAAVDLIKLAKQAMRY